MKRHDRLSPARQTPHRPETFYSHHRPATSALALVTVGTAVVSLIASGTLTPVPTAAADGAVSAQAHQEFLSDLATHRPSDEIIVRAGTSRPGLPVSIASQDITGPGTHRVVFRCHGTGTVRITALTSDGVRHRFPATDCGRPISALALSGYRSVTLTGDSHDAVLLWALTAQIRPQTTGRGSERP
ncbi:hypothetical protein ACIQHY_12655 [Streptomyces sp. NPDC092359]|uniref:hypothetical protein n=1 Tax=Streptomyces sp. NPDC092359 TaxID=3366014 RepID=UPI0037F6B9CB